MKILVVDDNNAFRCSIIDSLNKEGFQDVVSACDGQEALEKFDKTIDLVLTDRKMPNMDGVNLVRKLRTRSDGVDVPIIMIVLDGPLHVSEAQEAGANHHIVKPFTHWGLRRAITDVLKQMKK